MLAGLKQNTVASKLLAFLLSLAILAVGHTFGGDSASKVETARHAAIPLGLESPLPVPEDNPLTPEKIALGRKLFLDPILSESGSVSCATCHLPEAGFAGSTPVQTGIDEQKGRRNSPSLLNRAYARSLFWDGRAATLEVQALQPIQNPVEMGASIEKVLERLRANAAYGQAFQSAFGAGVSTQNIARALASFQRTLLTGNSPVDRFRNSDFSALSDAARQGLWLFESRGLCWRCHSGRNFTDEDFHNTGVSWGKAPVDAGRFEITGADQDRGRFKTPSLRDAARTAPYMHDGSLATLREVVEFYSRGGTANPNLDSVMKPLHLSEEEISSLVHFLEALTGAPAAEASSK
jgi:cytochrome c peroxidase